jgi:hypothetical protein
MTAQETKTVEMLASDDIRVAGEFVAKDKPFTCSPSKAVELISLGKARHAKEPTEETETAAKGTTKAAK